MRPKTTRRFLESPSIRDSRSLSRSEAYSSGGRYLELRAPPFVPLPYLNLLSKPLARLLFGEGRSLVSCFFEWCPICLGGGWSSEFAVNNDSSHPIPSNRHARTPTPTGSSDRLVNK